MSVGTPLDPIAPITTEEGTPSPKIVTTLQYPWEHVVQVCKETEINKNNTIKMMENI